MLVNNNSNNQNKAVAYVRVSSQKQAEDGVSIAAQIKRIKEYANFKGIILEDEDILIERGVSGGIPLGERPKGGKLKRMLNTGKYEHIITMKLDRMFRLVSDMLATVDELDAAGFALHMVDFNGEAIDTSSAMGRFFLIMSAAMAEMERGLISERTDLLIPISTTCILPLNNLPGINKCPGFFLKNVTVLLASKATPLT